ncbi:CDP-glycerol glycerophosphotransferase family protein, partial [Streptomyces sp. NPDC127574]
FRARLRQSPDAPPAEPGLRRELLGEPPAAITPVLPLAERRPAPAASTLVRS